MLLKKINSYLMYIFQIISSIYQYLEIEIRKLYLKL